MNRNLADMTIGVDATIKDALRAINVGAHGIAFVCDGDGRVLGTLTDGDIRRAILGGASLDSRCVCRAMHEEFSFVGPAEGRADVLDMMRARDIDQVPALDSEKRLVGLHLLHELIGSVQRDNWAVIMAGGRGARLRPLTENVPKPMLTVAGRPILERMVLHLVRWGMRRVFLSVNYMSEVIEEHLNGDEYARKLLLRSSTTGSVVLVGIMQIDLRHCGFDVREEILAKGTPLGRILIEHNVLRWIEPHAFYRVEMNAALQSRFEYKHAGTSTCGRVAQIFCNNKPAIQLLEVVSPE